MWWLRGMVGRLRLSGGGQSPGWRPTVGVDAHTGARSVVSPHLITPGPPPSSGRSELGAFPQVSEL